MHDFTELFKIVGDKSHIYSEKAVQFVNRPKKMRDRKNGNCYNLDFRVATNKPFRIYDEIGSDKFRYGYQYGERLWFDSLEELEQFRVEEKERMRIAKIEKAKAEIARNLQILREMGEIE